MCCGVWELLLRCCAVDSRTFCYFASSPPGRFATTLDDSLPGRFATTLDDSLPGRFATTLDDSLPGRFATTLDDSLPGRFATTLDDSLPGRFATTLDDSLPGRFAAWTVRYLDVSPPASFAPLNVSIPGAPWTFCHLSESL